MLKKLSNIFVLLCLIISLFLLLLLPLVTYRIGIEGAIFPALEIIVIYYFSLNYQVKYWQIFITGLFFDQLYHFPLGTNALAFLLATLALNRLRFWALVRTDMLSFAVFCGYSLFVLCIRYLIMVSKTLYLPNIVEMLFQYLMTIFSYSLLIISLDKLLYYLKKYVR